MYKFRPAENTDQTLFKNSRAAKRESNKTKKPKKPLPLIPPVARGMAKLSRDMDTKALMQTALENMHKMKPHLSKKQIKNVWLESLEQPWKNVAKLPIGCGGQLTNTFACRKRLELQCVGTTDPFALMVLGTAVSYSEPPFGTMVPVQWGSSSFPAHSYVVGSCTRTDANASYSSASMNNGASNPHEAIKWDGWTDASGIPSTNCAVRLTAAYIRLTLNRNLLNCSGYIAVGQVPNANIFQNGTDFGIKDLLNLPNISYWSIPEIVQRGEVILTWRPVDEAFADFTVISNYDASAADPVLYGNYSDGLASNGKTKLGGFSNANIQYLTTVLAKANPGAMFVVAWGLPPSTDPNFIATLGIIDAGGNYEGMARQISTWFKAQTPGYSDTLAFEHAMNNLDRKPRADVLPPDKARASPMSSAGPQPSEAPKHVNFLDQVQNVTSTVSKTIETVMPIIDIISKFL